MSNLEIKTDVQEMIGQTLFVVRAWIDGHKGGLQMAVRRSQINRAKKLMSRQLVAEHERVQARVAQMRSNAPH